MGYKKLCLDLQIRPNHLANSLQFFVRNPVESGPAEHSGTLEAYSVSFVNQHHRTAHQLQWPLHPANLKNLRGPLRVWK